ncbi:MAG TPA: ABC transporter ATP-binding protein [bacterium]|nr:ABC transporter ATP-binding protein [bacterium]
MKRFFFESIKEEVKRNKETVEVKPLTADGQEETEQKPLTLKDHWLSLRQSVQEKITTGEPTEEEQERTKLLSELITPKLMTEYKQILRDFNVKVKKTEEHPQREFIDINNEEFSASIENWIENLIDEVKNKKETGFDENDVEELRAQCWLFFDSMGNVMNTKSLERDIGEFYKDKTEEVDEKETAKQKTKLIKQLQDRYPLDKTEIEILVDLIKAEKGLDKNYSLRILVETIASLWHEYNLGDKKGGIAKISLGYLMSKGAESFAPYLFQNIIGGDKFNVAVFLEYFGLNITSDIINTKTEIELAKVMNEINQQINERMTNSLFFQEFEFIHEKKMGEIFSTLERGKKATKQILEETISQFAPTLVGIIMSIAFLSKINPALGAIGVGGLPIMYKIAKEQNEKINQIYEKEWRAGEKITTRLGAIKSGFEEIKTSPEITMVASHAKEQMDARDKISLQRIIAETKMRLLRMIPFNVSTVVAAGVGGALQEAGMISGGAVLSNIIYSERLNGPVQNLVNLYFNRFSRYIQDIQRMEEVFGKYEQLDRPEGEREKDRLPISELKNFDISIKNLKYKEILRGVNLNIKQGEFITIAGVSGAGKSTLIKNLVGLYKPNSGEIKIGGVKNDQIKKYGPESIYSAMSYCNQNSQIFEGMNLRENLLLWSKKEVSDQKIKKILKNLHLDNLVDKLDEETKNLSGGEKVRIGLARTLIKGAKIMLLDEPTASLDSQSITEVIKVISELHEKYIDTTIICVTHDEDLIKTSKRTITMSELQN